MHPRVLMLILDAIAMGITSMVAAAVATAAAALAVVLLVHFLL